MKLTQKAPRQHPVKKMVVIGTSSSDSFIRIPSHQNCIEFVIVAGVIGEQFKHHDTKQFNI